MNVLIVANGFPPDQIGGTETYTAGLARALAAGGHRVRVLCGGDWDTGPRYWNGVSDERHGDVRVRRVHVNWTLAPDPFRYLFDNPETARLLERELAAERPDVVHVTSCERLSASVVHAAKDAGVPVVLSLTDFWFLCPRMTLLRGDQENCVEPASAWDCTRCLAHDARVYRWPRAVLPESAVAVLLTTAGRVPLLSRQRGLRGMVGDMAARARALRRAFDRADCRITASAFVRDRFVAGGFGAPVRVQPYGHDLAWLAGTRGRTAAPRIRLGYIGQVAPHKGVHLLLEALRALEPSLRERFAAAIYGDLEKRPEYAGRLRALASGLPEVSFPGTYPHERSGDVFANLDVLVVPSLWYDFPLIVHEAFACGTPVVATRLGGMAEAVRDGVDGLLFARNDVAALADALRRLADGPDLLDRLRRGIRPVRTMREEAADMEALYRSLRAA